MSDGNVRNEWSDLSEAGAQNLVVGVGGILGAMPGPELSVEVLTD